MTDTPQTGSPADPANDPVSAGAAVVAAPAPPATSQDPDKPAADTAKPKRATAAAEPADNPKVGPPSDKQGTSGESRNKEEASGEWKNKKEEVSGELKNKDSDQSVERERLIYRPVEQGGERQRRPRPNERADRFNFLRLRLEEIVARDEEEPVVILGVRHERGLPHEALPGKLPGRLFVRSDQSGWGPLKRSSFDDLRASFADAARAASESSAGLSRDMASIVFLDWVPYTEKSGDLARLIDGAYDGRVDEFEAWLKEKGFRLFLVLAIDRPINTTTVLNLNPRIRLLPWTDLWLSAFAGAQSLPPNEFYPRIGDALRRAGKWDGSDDDNREKVLSYELQKLTRDHDCSELTAALAAIDKALERAEGEMSDVSFKSSRKDLARHLGVSERAESVDPITQVMLVVAAFAGGTRVEEYYAVCRELLPSGPAETLRLPMAVQEMVLRDAAQAERMNRECAPLPGWDVVFDAERDAALSKLQIRVVEGQEIQIGNKWRIIDLKREITREYPGLIHSLIQRICDRRLLLTLSEAEAALLLRVICAIRDACEEGFNDQALASALSGAQHGLSDLGTPLDIVATLFPGRDPEQVLKLLENIQRHRQLAQSLDAIGKPNPELLESLHALEGFDPDITPENFLERFERRVAQLREGSVRRLTRHILRMRASSSAASENRRPIIASMLRNLETMLQTDTYVSMLTYMLATGSEIDPLAIGRLLQREVARANGMELGAIVGALRARFGAALASANAPHKNWLIAFDSVRAGMAPDDRIRAVAVVIWDLAINEDVRWRIMPYERMKHLRLVCRLFARPVGIVDQNIEGDVLVNSQVPDEALIERVAKGFFAQDPADWLAALAALGEIQAGPPLQRTVMNRIGDVVWVIMTGAVESECAVLRSNDGRLATELLAALTSALKLGPETDFWAAASRVIRAHLSPTDRFSRRWLPLYGLFWPAMLAHWRFTAFGLEPLQPGSEDDKCFRILLDRIVAAAPGRSARYRDGFAALATGADKCAARAASLRAPASAELYRLKADRLRGLQAFFDEHAAKALIAV